MERRLLLVKNGGTVVRLPPGFRFHPTDEELVVEYLKRKAFSFPVPPSIIPELHLCTSDPWDLPGDTEQERYFFTRREVKYRNGNRSNRATPSGYWKATGIDKKVITSRRQLVVGMKKTLVFYTGKPPHGSRTDWVMHEYRLLQPCKVEMENYWVICRIFLKKTSSSKKQVSSSPVFYDFLANENIPNSSEASSSSWSGITNVSSPISNQMEGPEEEEESSSSSSSSSSCYHDLSLTTKPAPP